MLRASPRRRWPLPRRELNSDCQISRASSPRVLFSDCNAISWHFSALGTASASRNGVSDKDTDFRRMMRPPKRPRGLAASRKWSKGAATPFPPQGPGAGRWGDARPGSSSCLC